MYDEQYERLVSNIYGAGAGRMPWPKAFEPLIERLDLWGVQLLGVDKRAGTLLFSYETGDGAPAILDYLRAYHQINPRIQPSMMLGLDEWMNDHEHFDDAYVAQSPFYQDFLIPHGSRYLSGTKIIEDEQTLVLFGAMRGIGKRPLGSVEMEYLNRVKRHLVEAMKIYLHLRLAHSELSVGKQLLNQFQYPMLLVDEQRGIRFRNRIAEQTLKTTDFIVERNGAIGCRDPASDLRLTVALRALNLSGTDQSSPGMQRRFVRVMRMNGDPIAVYATALRPSASMEAFGQMSLALLVFHDPMRQGALDPFIVAEFFDLTPAEAKACVALASGLTPEDTAKAHGVAVSTIRSQLKTIYAKTGTNRQADLMRILNNLGGFEPTHSTHHLLGT